jgi:hypothetical protein
MNIDSSTITAVILNFDSREKQNERYNDPKEPEFE